MGLTEEQVTYVAYTGKAANVLKNKGCPGATTAHKLIYHARLMPNGRYTFRPKPALDPELKVVVVDEVSMLPKDMWDLLCGYNIYILACGDPEQLPPVNDNPKIDINNHVLDHPHIFLDEIMRQAQESEIIRLSMHVREGKPLYTFPCNNEQVMIIRQPELTTPMLTWADQILCATKKTRTSLNAQMRAAKGFGPEPEIGDKVINLHNEWDLLSTHGNPLTNGVIGTIKQLENQTWDYPYWIRNQKLSVPIITATIAGDEEDETFDMISFDYTELNTGEPVLSKPEEYTITKRLEMPTPLHFNYGYAITVWKAQGSEWGKVLLFQEPTWPRDLNERRRYMYTGITRAVDRLVVVGN